MNWLFLIALLIMVCFYVSLAIFFAKGMESNEDYYLAGRSLGIWRVTFTLVATQIGGGLLTGSSDESYVSGYYGLLYSVGMCLGFILLGCGFAGKLRNFNISTIPELFEKKFSSNNLKMLASLLMVLSLAGILVGQIIASKKLIFALGFHSNIVLVAFWLFIIAYTVAGGLKAVVFADVYQVIAIIIIFTTIFFYCAISFHSFNISGLSNLTKLQHGFKTPDINYTTLFLMPMMFSLIEQDLAQRFFAAKTAKVAIISAFLAGLIVISFAVIPVYFGMQAKFMGLAVPTKVSALIMALEKMSVGNIAIVLAVCCILAAIVSTGDSLLCAISSNISQDFNFSFLKIKNKVTLSRWITLIIGITAIIIAFYSDNIFRVLIESYTIPVSCLFVPIMFCYFFTTPSKYGAISSVIFGGGSILILRFISNPIPALSPALASVIFSFMGYVIGWGIQATITRKHQA